MCAQRCELTSGMGGGGGRTLPWRAASRNPPGVSCPASHVPRHIVRANGCCAGVVASCAIAVPPRSYVSCTAPPQSHAAPKGGPSVPSSGARLSGVRCVCVRFSFFCTYEHGAYLVVPHYD